MQKFTASSLEKLILKQLKAPTKSAPYVARYVGGVDHEDREEDEMSTLVYFGNTLPTLRAATKTVAEKLSSLSEQNQWDLLVQVWKKTNIYDIRTIVLIWMGGKKNKMLRKKNVRDLIKMVSDVDNWALSDQISSYLAEIFEDTPALERQFQKWNKSKHPWERRQSIVGIYCYARLRKRHYPAPKTLKLIEALLDDPHIYVQKGVGWTLREVDRVDPKLQKQFVKKHLHRISGVAWFATSELYPLPLKKQLVALRKDARASARLD